MSKALAKLRYIKLAIGLCLSCQISRRSNQEKRRVGHSLSFVLGVRIRFRVVYL